MSTLFFPAGLTIDFRNVNIEEMEYYSRSWNLERIQMQKGLFSGSMFATHTPRMQLMHAPYSHGVLLQGDFPKGTILIAYVATKADVTFQNKQTQEHQIKILRSGDEIDFLCNGENETFTIAVQEQFFYEAYESYFGVDFSSSAKHQEIYITPQLLSHFHTGIVKWLNYLMQDHTLLKIEKHYGQIELEILHHVFSCIHFEEDQKPRQKFQIKKVRDLLHESIENPSQVPTLARELGISESLLHHGFKTNYGITPKQYLLSLRMHGMKQALLNSDPETTISSILAEHHFFNQSTFTQAYKHMFGQNPSETLKKQH